MTFSSIFSLMSLRPPRSPRTDPLFPYRLSSDLSICVLDPDGKTVVEGQAKTNPFEIGRDLQKRLEGPLKLGIDRILALPWAAQERRLLETRREVTGRVT